MAQRRSDADHSSSERDQAQDAADRKATQRDKTAVARDRSVHATTDQKFLEAFAAIQEDHARSTAEREAAAEDRAQAAADRVRAAEDREVAAQDRDHASFDREQAKAELERGRTELEEAQLDDLTGFYRLSLGTAALQHEVDRSRRSGGDLVLAYFDVDGLKQVNDEEGHAAGDVLLQCLAEAIRSQLRSYDPVVRIGGDEFVCVLSNTDLNEAGRVCGDVQDAFSKKAEGANVSVGLAALRDDDDLGALLERSDYALREARSGSPSRRERRVPAGARRTPPPDQG